MNMEAQMLRKKIKAAAKQQLLLHFWPCLAMAALWVVPTVAIQLLLQNGLLNSTLPDTLTKLFLENLQVLGDTVDSSVRGTLAQQSALVAVTLLSEALFVGVLFLLSPLRFAIHVWSVRVIRREKPAVMSLFSFLEDGRRITRAFGASILYALRALAIFAGYCIGPVLLTLFALWSMVSLNQTLGMSVYSFSGFLTFSAAVCAFARVNAMTPAMVMAARDADVPVFQCFRKTKQLMWTHIWEFFAFRISFLLWDVLSTFTYGAASLLYLPLLENSIAGYLDALEGRAPKIEMPPEVR